MTNVIDKRYTLNIEKLSRDIRAKRNRHRVPWQMIAVQSGVGQTTLVSIARERTPGSSRSVDANTLIGILMWLGQPLERYIVENNDKEKEGSNE